MGKTKVKVIEVEGIKLDPKAKYIIRLHPSLMGEFQEAFARALNKLIGGNFLIVPLEDGDMTIYEVLPEGELEP